MSPFTETAYAKINLALTVRSRRPDGYHDIETLFAFADDGDRISVLPSDKDELTIGGEFAGALSNGPDNLVLQALSSMRAMVFKGYPQVPPLAIHLEKRLPVAAGIGGGSADAAALIRLVDRHFLRNGDNKELILLNRRLGADVAACIVSRTRLGFGTGSDLCAVEADDIASIPLLLVNPRLPVPTGTVFAAWDGIDRGAIPVGSALDTARNGRNDLEQPAIRLVPQIGDVLAMLKKQSGADLVRMSGSGATCFALFTTAEARDAGQRNISKACPDWWTMTSCLR